MSNSYLVFKGHYRKRNDTVAHPLTILVCPVIYIDYDVREREQNYPRQDYVVPIFCPELSFLNDYYSSVSVGPEDLQHATIEDTKDRLEYASTDVLTEGSIPTILSPQLFMKFF